jgi:hypothetical protein
MGIGHWAMGMGHWALGKSFIPFPFPMSPFFPLQLPNALK